MNETPDRAFDTDETQAFEAPATQDLDAFLFGTPEDVPATETPEAPEATPEAPALPFTPQRYAAAPQPEYVRTPQAAQKQTPAKKRVSRVWIPILLIAALLLGIAGLAGGYFIGRDRVGKTTDTPFAQPTLPERFEDEDTPAEQPPVSERTKPAQTGDGKTPAEIYSENVSAVVGIACESTGRNVWGQTVTQAVSGSGFILTSDGFVVTNYHVVEDATTVTVQLYDGREFSAQIVGYENNSCDVALLKIDANDLPTVSVGNSDDLQVGDQVCAIGNPLGELTFSLTVGYVSSLDREINTDGRPINMLQTDAAINAGNSGGPLFDMNGNVIGINTAKYSASAGETSVEGLGFAIPINDIMKIADDLTQYGYVTGKPYLGVSVGDSGNYGENLPAGAYIGEVIPGYAAEKAGLQVGDVIVGLGESVIGSQSDLSKALSSHSAGETVAVTVYRAGQYLSLQVTLDERPKDADTTEPEATEAPTEAPTEEEGGFPWGDWGDWGDWSFFP